jgi:hypothetical protein
VSHRKDLSAVVPPEETTGWQIGRAVRWEAVWHITLAAVFPFNSLLPQKDYKYNQSCM